MIYIAILPIIIIVNILALLLDILPQHILVAAVVRDKEEEVKFPTSNVKATEVV